MQIQSRKFDDSAVNVLRTNLLDLPESHHRKEIILVFFGEHGYAASAEKLGILVEFPTIMKRKEFKEMLESTAISN